jgi:hypothetical protein
MKHKKGALLFAPILVIMMIVGLIYAWATIVGKYNAFDKKIGERQFELIDTYQTGEKVLFYIDQSAKCSIYQSIYDLAKNGGCSNGNKYVGYTLWVGECNPDSESSKTGFLNVFSDNLNNYLSEYDSVELPLDNFNLNLDNGQLVGTGIEPLKIPIEQISRRTSGQIGFYSIKPTFKQSVDYDFSDYDELKENAEELIDKCKDEDDIESCIIEHEFYDDDLELIECETEEEKVFYDFLEYLDRCVNSDEDDVPCICEGSLNGGHFYIKKEDEKIKIEKTNDEKFEIYMENIALGNDQFRIKDDTLLAKDGEGSLTSGKKTDEIPYCTLNDKTKFRVCVKSNENQFYVYDDNKVELRNVVYKFALEFSE